MARYLLRIEYHGGGFAGWQRQNNALTVQQVLEEALVKIDPAAPTVTGAGRTDSGVHALGQMAHVDLERDWSEPRRLRNAMNAHLRQHPVSVINAWSVAETFHARFDAIERQYRYRIICRPAPPSVEQGLVWHLPWPLNASAMAEAARSLIGHHDFTTFRSAHCQASSPLRTLDALEIEADGERIEVVARARSFLHRQVRSMIGTLERVGAGAWSVADVAKVLQACDRSACGPVAPPEGLYLEYVRYP